MELKAGDVAPDFRATCVSVGDAEPTTIRLGDLRGERVILVFYPKDSTPGCTTQACAMRDGWEELKVLGRVFGVSVDSPASHQRFIEKQSLPFPLLSDEAKEIVEAYGVWVEKTMYGKRFMGTERATFVIDPEGKIEVVMRRVRPKDHLEKLFAALG